MLKLGSLSILAVSALACIDTTALSTFDPEAGVIGTDGGNESGASTVGTAVLQTGNDRDGSRDGDLGIITSSKPGELIFIVRDFKFYDPSDPTTNLDFENVPTTDGSGVPVEAGTYWGPWRDFDIVNDQLDADHKPVYKNSIGNDQPDADHKAVDKNSTGKTLSTHGKASFDQWFRNVPGTNITQTIPVTLTQKADGTYEYDSSQAGPLNKNGMFFPIDDGTPYATPFGNQGQDGNGVSHNFSFTLEIHTVFTYEGGEHFYFRGDDDVFVFIDKKLVINLGGIHGTDSKDVAIDSLGLSKGRNYSLDFFYAERHVVQSDLLITTGLKLANNDNIPVQ